MSLSSKRLILPALLITIGLSVILILLQQIGSEPLGTRPLKGTWAHSFKDNPVIRSTRSISPAITTSSQAITDTSAFDADSTWSSGYGYGHEVYRMDNTAYTEAGLTLSHLQPINNPLLNLGGRESSTVDSQGRFISVLNIPVRKWLPFFTNSLTETTRLIEYDPTLQQATDLGQATEPGNEIWYLAASGDRYIYMSVYNQSTYQTSLRMFDRTTGQFKDLGTFKSYVDSLVGTHDGQVYGSAYNRLFKYDPIIEQLTDLGMPFNTDRSLSNLIFTGSLHNLIFTPDERQLYGLVESDIVDYQLFRYDLDTRTTITLTESIWGYGLVLFENKLYGYNKHSDPEQMLAYDLSSHTLTELGNPPQLIPEWRYHFEGMAVDTTGSVYATVSSYSFPFTDYLFQYSPTTNKKTYVQSLGNLGGSQLFTGPDDRMYWSGGPLHFYDPHTYVPTGTIESSIIKADMLIDQYVELGRAPTLISALAWGNDGALYGVTSRVWQPGGSWLFRYDPARPDEIMPITDALLKSDWPQGASALIADRAGKLIAGSGDHLVTYDPVTHVATNITVPLTGTWQIGVLTLGLNGHVYGTTVTSRSHGNPHLFEYDPTSGIVQDLGVPAPDIDHVYALATAPDGTIYGGGGVWSYSAQYDLTGLSGKNILFAYNPNNGSVQRFNPPRPSHDFTEIRAMTVAPTGQVYLGLGQLFYPGGSFLVYDPATNQFTVLPLPVPGSVNALTLDGNGVIHGSTETLTGGYLFTYDPHQPDRTPQASGSVARNGIVTLIAGPGNVMYGALGAHNSFYSGAAGLVKFQSECPYGVNGVWDQLTYQATTPPHTDISIDILDPKNNLLLAGVKNGGSLVAIDTQRYPAIKLRAILTSDDPSVTPILGDWRVTYDFHCATQLPSPTPTVIKK
jgi:hypothetical protein